MKRQLLSKLVNVERTFVRVDRAEHFISHYITFSESFKVRVPEVSVCDVIIYCMSFTF